MAVVVDTRTSVFGNMLIATGTYAGGDTHNLGELFSEVLAVICTPTGVSGAGVPVNAELNSLVVNFDAAAAGKFMAIGFRT